MANGMNNLGLLRLMHDIMEMRCAACSFSVRGIPERHARLRACALCGAVMLPAKNYSASRRLPMGLGLLMGAFAASVDTSPLAAQEPDSFPGFARHHA